MIDANSQFFAILTNVGMAKQANADALGIPWKFTDMGVGDANNTDPIPSAAQTRLINEWRRRALNQVRVDPANSAVIIAEQIIPADEGGHWIREIGLYDADGDLVAVANCAPSFKPVLSQGSGRTQVVRMNFIVSSTGNITLKIDPAVVLATREYVDQRIMEELYKLDSKQSVRVATTANIALAGLLTIDGIVLAVGDRVLVKNQDIAKDNGLYIVSASPWKRAEDADSNVEVTSALLVSIEQGTTQADTRWQLVTDGTIILGATALIFQNITQGFAPINSPALLGTPSADTPPLFNSSKRLANTEFVQLALGNMSGIRIYDVTASMTASDFGRLVLANSGSAITLTLPAIGNVPIGATIHIRNVGGAPLTVVPPAGGTMSAIATRTLPSVLVSVGSSLEVTVQGSNYFMAGSASLKHISDFAASTNHQNLPSGYVEQNGLYVGAPSGSDTLITLPFALSEVPNDIQLTFANFATSETVGNSPVLQARDSTLGTITVRNLHNVKASFFWRVRGKA